MHRKALENESLCSECIRGESTRKRVRPGVCTHFNSFSYQIGFSKANERLTLLSLELKLSLLKAFVERRWSTRPN